MIEWTEIYLYIQAQQLVIYKGANQEAFLHCSCQKIFVIHGAQGARGEPWEA